MLRTGGVRDTPVASGAGQVLGISSAPKVTACSVGDGSLVALHAFRLLCLVARESCLLAVRTVSDPEQRGTSSVAVREDVGRQQATANDVT